MTRRLGSFALAAVVVAGVVTAVFPQHAWSIARVAAVAVAALSGAVALAAVGALSADDPEPTALDRSSAGRPAALEPHGLRDARRDLDRVRHPGGLPRSVQQRLRVAAQTRLNDVGVDIENRSMRPAVRRMLSTDTWELLSTPPRPGGTADPDAVAVIVHRTLDELDDLRTGAGT